MTADRPRLRRGDLLPRMSERLAGRATAAHLRRAAASETDGLTPPRDGAPVVWQEARGANVLDLEGNRYVDLTAGFGVAAIGHRHPRVVAAVRRQAGRLLHALGDVHAHPRRAELAAALAARAPLPDPRVAFAVSGADAVELAIKTAVHATGRHRLLAFEPSYHGLTLGALNVSSRPEFRQVVAGHLHDAVDRLPYGCAPDRVAAALADGDTAAVVVEPIVGREGVLVPPAGWLAAVADACRRHGTLLVADEVFTGFGRTGRWFAVEHEAVEPDLVCCGKALGGGVPVAAVIGRRRWMAAWDRPGEAPHTATFVAHPLACAAALESLRVLAGERLIPRAAAIGRRLERRLGGWPATLDGVEAVRGRGALWGVALRDRALAHRAVAAARRRGVLLLAGGPEGRVAQIAPPLVITDRQLDRALELLRAAIAAAADDQ